MAAGRLRLAVLVALRSLVIDVESFCWQHQNLGAFHRGGRCGKEMKPRRASGVLSGAFVVDGVKPHFSRVAGMLKTAFVQNWLRAYNASNWSAVTRREEFLSRNNEDFIPC